MLRAFALEDISPVCAVDVAAIAAAQLINGLAVVRARLAGVADKQLGRCGCNLLPTVLSGDGRFHVLLVLLHSIQKREHAGQAAEDAVHNLQQAPHDALLDCNVQHVPLELEGVAHEPRPFHILPVEVVCFQGLFSSNEPPFNFPPRSGEELAELGPEKVPDGPER